MRLFNLISSCLCWLVLVFYWAGGIFMYAKGTAKPSAERLKELGPEVIQNSEQVFGTTAVLMGVLALSIWWLRRFFWFKPGQELEPRSGFWLVTVVMYLSVLLCINMSFVPHLLFGHRGPLVVGGFAAGAVFLVLCFPRVPRRH